MKSRLKLSGLAALGIAALISGAAYANQSFQAYCDTEKMALQEWTHDEAEAHKAMEHHLHDHPDHHVVIHHE